MISKTHNEVTFSPLPGSRFTNVARIDGHAVVIEYERGKARELANWLHHWVTNYIEPLADAEERASKAIKEAEALKAIEAENEKVQAIRDSIQSHTGKLNPALVAGPAPVAVETPLAVIAEMLAKLTPDQIATLVKTVTPVVKSEDKTATE